MDPLDFRLLRALYQDGNFRLGSLDPRLSIATMAQKAGMPRSTAQARLAQWRESGFFKRSDVWPNPALFGVGNMGIGLFVPDASAKLEALRSVRLVDGMLGAIEFVGTFTNLLAIDDAPTAVARRIALLERIPGVAKVSVLGAFPIPRPPEPTPLQWRIIEALRAEPDATLPDLAAKLGRSARTMTRSYTEIVENRMAWFIPKFDYSKFPGVIARTEMVLGDETSKSHLVKQIHERFPDVLWHTHDQGRGATTPAPKISFFLQFENAAAVEETVQWLTALSGVKDVRTNFPLRITTFPEWFDERLAARSTGLAT